MIEANTDPSHPLPALRKISPRPKMIENHLEPNFPKWFFFMYD